MIFVISIKEDLFMDFRFIKTAILAMGLVLTCTANANIYDFAETIQGISITGSFDGTANGNDITGISNISIITDGVAFSGPLESDGFIGLPSIQNNGWVQGQGVVSINGESNNFMFINQGYAAYYPFVPTGLVTNYLISVPPSILTDHQFVSYGYIPYIQAATSFGSPSPFPTNWSVTDVTTVPVPAAAWLFGSALAGLIGFNRRKSMHQAV